MAKKIPVNNWITKQIPKVDPKFQFVVIEEGVGKSIKPSQICLVIGEIFIIRIDRN